jgi:catechol 2,3-dioxygenase-like lactoylglutathione lyase family enzyme
VSFDHTTPRVDSVDHINIVVSDMARSVHFYTQLLGFEEFRRAHLEGEWIEAIVGLKGVEADVVYVQPPGGGPRIELIRYLAPEGVDLPETALPNTVGLRHIAFRVAGIETLYAQLKEAGVPFIGPPVVVPTNVITHDAGHKVLCYFRDPDGVVLEFAEYR